MLTIKQLPDTNDYCPYRNVFDQLNIDQGVVLLGSRVIVPTSLRGKILKVLHEEHMGIGKTKALARSYVWWPRMDDEIELMIKSCFSCQSNRNNPPIHNTHSWEYPKGPWQRLHIDFAGPYKGVTYMVIVDAYSKWPEVVIMNSITSYSCIKVLSSLFSRHGIPLAIVSDNGPQFCSSEFSKFLNNFNIKHTRTAPYHPATNGEAERFVQTLKNYLKINEGNIRDLDDSLQKFLFTYRVTPHSTTGYAPSVLLCKRLLRGTLDLLKPDICNDMNIKQNVKLKDCKPVPIFNLNDSVLVRNYSDKRKWIPGIIVKLIGNIHFLIDVEGTRIKRHVDQIKPVHNQDVADNLGNSIVN